MIRVVMASIPFTLLLQPHGGWSDRHCGAGDHGRMIQNTNRCPVPVVTRQNGKISPAGFLPRKIGLLPPKGK
jgi:hypothetical protein